MRTISFNKSEETATCLYCKKNRVPIKDWKNRCSDCKKKRELITSEPRSVSIASRQPAAVIENLENKEKIFVDKFGREVHHHGYDLENDPRGYKRNQRTSQVKRTVI